MVDPHLNSVHLDLPRRQEFRRAREALLNSCGQNTLCAEPREAPEPHPNATWFTGDVQGPSGEEAPYVLAESDHTYHLKIGLNTVGRLPDNDVVVADGHVSRRHCAVVVHSNLNCEIHDVASKNGTFLNGQRVSCPTRLRPGDEIGLGDLRLVLKPVRDTDRPGKSDQTSVN